ncbi:MAG: thymidine kinase [Bacilli bacterium]|nr:thymidine kinase [Bacilli bacterium]
MDLEVKNKGWIEVIAGPMFAGKSEELLRRIRRLDYAKQKYVVFKPAIDTRYSKGELVSHIKNKSKAIPIKKAHEIYKHISYNTDVVIIDEAQFLDIELVDICEKLANEGRRVICAGLDMDFRGEPFEVMAQLLSKAEDVMKLTAICMKCGAPATRSQRIINGKPARYDDPIVVVGAEEAYEPRCRHCHEVKK